MIIRTATMEDLDQIAAVEGICFPPEEAAERETFRDRLRHYGNHFLLMMDNDRLIAFVDGFVTDEPDLTDEMYEKLLREMTERARAEGRQGLVLTCKEAKIPFYARLGFRDEGLTEKSTHGGAAWHQMRLRFDPVPK